MKRVLLVLLTVAIAGGFYVVAAQQQQGQQLQTSKDLPKKITVPPGYKGPPFFTFKGTYYGFLTDNKDRRLGSKVTPDQIRASVAAGAKYVLGGVEVGPPEKAAPYAGQWVKITALYKSNQYGSGATSDPSIDGYYAGDGTVSTRVPSIEIVSVKPATPPNDGTGAPTGVGGAGISADTVGPGYGVSSPAK